MRQLTKDKESKEEEKHLKDPRDDGEYVLRWRIKKVKNISTEDMKLYLQRECARSGDTPQICINMVDTLLKKVNRAFLAHFIKAGGLESEARCRQPKDLLSVYSGFSFSVRPQWKCRLNVDVVSMWAFDWLHC